jgi:hypothetical protein
VVDWRYLLCAGFVGASETAPANSGSGGKDGGEPYARRVTFLNYWEETLVNRKMLFRLVALLGCWLLAIRPAEADYIYFTADNQINTGYMLITGVTGSFSDNQWSITITAMDTSPTISYSDVGLTLQYIYPADDSGDPNAAGLAYDSGTETWSNGLQKLLYTAVSPGPLDSVPISETNAPQIWSSQPNGYPASLLSTDVVPFFGVGDFSPLESKNFTLTADVLAGGEFPFQTVGFFVVPEPGAAALLASGAALLLLALMTRALFRRFTQVYWAGGPWTAAQSRR